MEVQEIVFLVVGLIWLVLNIAGTVMFALKEGKELLRVSRESLDAKTRKRAKIEYGCKFALFLTLIGFIRLILIH